MAWVQKKFLAFCLRYVGIFDDDTDLDNLDIALGQQSSVELRDVALSTDRLSKLVELPPGLRVEAAKILRLKLTIPLNVFSGPVTFEADGVRIDAKYQDPQPRSNRGTPTPTSGNPQHRKTHRRIGGTLEDSDGDDRPHIPTAEEMARSFLLERPPEERKQLEASVAAQLPSMDDSMVSETSEDSDVGTGSPGVFASYAQGLMDRCQVRINDVEVTLHTSMPRESADSAPLAVKVRLDSAALLPFESEAAYSRRTVKLGQLTVDLLSTETMFTDLSGLPSRASPALSRTGGRSVFSRETSKLSSLGLSSAPAGKIDEGPEEKYFEALPDKDVTEVLRSEESQSDRFLGRAEEFANPMPDMTNSELLDIRPGDDNISWGSRRNNTSSLEEEDDLWNSTEGLPDSLLLEQATAPRDKSRSASPEVFRHAKGTEAPMMSLQSPGSWPLPDGPSVEHQTELGLATWPSLNPGDARPEMEQEQSFPDYPSAIHEIDGRLIEDMTESRLYTREEAESMYMSAISHGPSYVEQPDSDSNEPTLSSSVERVAEHEHEIETPRPSSPVFTATSPDPRSGNTVSRQLVAIESIVLGLPRPRSDAAVSATSEADNPRFDANQNAQPHVMPGAFSVYSNASTSGVYSRRTANETAIREPQVSETDDAMQAVSIDIGPTRLDLDIACCRMLCAAFHTITNATNKPKSQLTRGDTFPASANATDWPSVSLTIFSVSMQLHEVLSSPTPTQAQESLCTVLCGHTEYISSSDRVNFSTKSLNLCIGNETLLSIDNPEQGSTSEGHAPGLSFQLAKERTFTNGKTFIELHVECTPVKINVNLHSIDQAFSSFGGISGFLDISSMLGESALAPTMPQKIEKGVRFEHQPSSAPKQEATANLRIEGISMVLQGESASVKLQTSLIKAVYRKEAITATIDRIKLTGPHIQQNQNPPPAEVGIDAVRIDFLQSPRDQDLERLLALLTPSKDKYDSDDDILLDTLLRQRRKGTLVRVKAGNINCQICTFDCLETLHRLVEEMSTLAAVAKYLPEDERPGLLTLLHLTQVNVRLPVNDRFGELDVCLKELHFAYVGIPSLLALSVQSVQAGSKRYGDIVRTFLPLHGADKLPLVMARMLGDEAEPVARIKLFNVCVEYTVPSLLALTGLADDAEAEQLASELVQSIATLNPFSHAPRSPEASPRPESSPPKAVKIDLLMHDLAIMLSPLTSRSKAALVLTDAKFTTLLPPGDLTTFNLELRKTALFLTNDHTVNQPFESRNAPRNSSSTARTATALAQQGYASIASIMSANICAKIEKLGEGYDFSQSVRVDVRNELLLLETCADSTQTLFSLLSGLAPPPRSDQQPKYLTQPMPIEDMMASFTGDAYQQPFSETARETLFDVEDLQEADSFMDEVGDDILAESDMTSSLYGPVSGMLTGVDRPEDDEESSKGDWEGAVESLLEDDPFEMPMIPTDAPLSDAALMRDLNKQSRKPVSVGEVSLEITEIEDLGLEGLGPEHKALGTVNKANTPSRGVQRHHVVYPVQLHLRDAHVIWNIYDGYDWQHTRDGITEAVEKVESKMEERKARNRRSRNDPEEDEPVIGDFLFNSIYIGVPTSQDAQDIRRQINRQIDDLVSETESVAVSGISRPNTQQNGGGGSMRDNRRRRRLKLDRSRAHKVAFELKGLSADVLVMPPSSETTLQNIQLRVRDFEIFDNVPTSTWRKFLTHFESEAHRREMAKPMIHVEVENVKTNVASETAELKINVTVAPLRLHVDQDALDFITRFFEFKAESGDTTSKPGEQPFIQRLEVNTVDLRLDYKPKHIDYASLRSGHTSEFMNFVTLDAADICLRHAIIYGIKGFDPLHKTLNDIWMPDIIRNQLPTVLSGLAPVRSLVNLGTGFRDVVAIPIREYRKDGRVVRSIQKGAFQFGKTTAAELARFGAKVALGTQNILQGAEGVLSGSNPASSSQRGPLGAAWQDVSTGEEEEHEHRAISSYANQPLGVFAGLRSARQQMERDLLNARDALIAIQGGVLESSTPGSAAAAVARHAPTLILRPVIGASRAVGTALLGVGNQIDRGNVRRVDDKYKRR